MKRLLKLFLSSFDYAIKREFEFKFNLLFFLVFNIVWILTSLAGISLVFEQAGTIAGWTRSQAMLLVLVYYITGSFIKSLVIPGANQLAELVRTGGFDFYLLRPVDAQLLVSLTKMYPNQLARVLIIAFALPWYLGKMGLAVSFGSWILFLILIILAVAAFYSLYFMIASLSFWLQNIFNLNDLFAEILDVGKRTTDIFTGVAGGAILFVVPVGLIATIPTKVLMGTAGWEILPWVLLSNLILFIISRKFFHFAVRFYSSASS
ncbi:ABC-2 family transporter protein [Candidatus Collierbacteria bacterium]|nr:ABC-2 family transporter protein [Candidatus Collierbacteria bacterium]